MPKSSKKKKDRAADFTKARLKLGKGKQQASNVIDTSFKARSIALPTQSIVVEKDDSVPLTKRNHSFNDLVSHLKHHNATVRKDAILGFKELFEARWDVLESNMSVFFSAIIRLIGDEESDVRKTLLVFFNWLVPRITNENLVPHSHLLLLYTTSAQTHIFPEIRIDAVRFLDIFLEKMPEVLVEGLEYSVKGHGQRILDGYLGLLKAGTKFSSNEGPLKATSTASVTLSPASNFVVLNSLSTFLRHALRTPDSQSPFPEATKPLTAWYLETAFHNREAFLEFEKMFSPWRSTSNQPSIRQPWMEVVEDEDVNDDFLHAPSVIDDTSSSQNWTFQNLIEVTSQPTSASNDEGSLISHLTRTLHSTFVAIFLDHAPAAFAPSGSPSDTDMSLVITVVQLARTLYQELVRKSPKAMEVHIPDLEAFLGFMAPYFPAESAGVKNIKFAQFVDTYNLIYCELASFLMITSHGESPRPSRKQKKAPNAMAKRHLRHFWEAGGVGEFIEQKLQGRSGTSGIPAAISSSAYLDFLPTIWTFINEFALSADGGSNAILSAMLDHSIKIPSKAATKRLTIEFVSRLILLDRDPQYCGNFRTRKRPADDQRFRDWLLHLPQVLWELGSTNLLATEMILLVLLRLLQSPSRLIDSQTVAQLQARLVPYFMINHAVRGPVHGPYSKLPPASPLRRLVLDMVSVLQMRAKPSKSETTATLVSAVSHAVEGAVEAKYWMHVRPGFS